MIKNTQKRLNIFNDSELAYMNALAERTSKPYLTNKEILDNIRLYRETGDSVYMDKVINNFIKLLIKKARQHKKSGINIGDLIHYGVEGIIEAVERSFNLDASERFITYVTIVIERRIKDGLDEQRSPVALPKNIMTEQRKLKRKLAERQDLEDHEFEKVYSKVNVEDFKDFTDILLTAKEETTVDSIEKDLDAESLQFDVFYVLETLLSPIEKDVIIHSFGLNGESAKAFETIGTLLNISATQRVRKIRQTALSKIRSNANSYNILQKYLS